MERKVVFANGENHWFLGIGKIEFEISHTGCNSVCIQIKGWNGCVDCDKKYKKKPDIIVTFDSPEYGTIEVKDITKEIRNFKYGYLEIAPLIKTLKEGKI